jgi:hypothetical protein
MRARMPIHVPGCRYHGGGMSLSRRCSTPFTEGPPPPVTNTAIRVQRPNDPSSATRPARTFDCNSDAMAGFAAAHG